MQLLLLLDELTLNLNDQQGKTLSGMVVNNIFFCNLVSSLVHLFLFSFQSIILIIIHYYFNDTYYHRLSHGV